MSSQVPSCATLLLGIGLLVTLVPREAPAQDEAQEPRLGHGVPLLVGPDEATEYSAQMRISARLQEGDESTHLPFDLLSQLTEMTGLERVKISQQEGNYTLQARFVISGFERFRDWYESENTETLLQELRRRAEGNLQIETELTRSSHSGVRHLRQWHRRYHDEQDE